ncbi:DUF2797 domain-containing protein [Nonomuraea sp. NPDC050790]|uniref:DUF2797 domain-containing protein n=1 Tax=Nonomuraea sp. NPDC050790 TaxID=3364371 RepID=UPI0037B384C8
MARDAVLGEEHRDWTLYLAWFGPGLVKVGLTAADRGADRLLEQGAITYTTLASGRYPLIRRAEQAASATRLARERIPARAKADAWWRLPDQAERASQTENAAQELAAATAWPDDLTLQQTPVHDLASAYGLHHPIPARYQEMTGLDEQQAVLAGQVRAVVGRQLLLDTPCGPVLADMRRVAGHTLARCDPSGALAGLHLTPRHQPRESDDQTQLF